MPDECENLEPDEDGGFSFFLLWPSMESRSFEWFCNRSIVLDEEMGGDYQSNLGATTYQIKTGMLVVPHETGGLRTKQRVNYGELVP